MTVDTGFDSVLAGEVYSHPEQVVGHDFGTAPASVTVADYKGKLAHTCGTLTPGGTRCDICFGPITVTVNQEPPCDSSTAAGSAPAPTSPTAPSGTSVVSSGPGLSPAGIQAAKALVALPELSWPELSKLARDMAMDIKERHVILAEHKLTQTQYDFLETHNDFYRNALAAACTQWHAPLSTQERIKVEAAAILEDSLLGLGSRMQNRAEGLPGVIEAAKLFAKVAGVGEPSGGGVSSGERFVINIDLGGDQKISVGVGGPPDPLPAPNQPRPLPPDTDVP